MYIRNHNIKNSQSYLSRASSFPWRQRLDPVLGKGESPLGLLLALIGQSVAIVTSTAVRANRTCEPLRTHELLPRPGGVKGQSLKARVHIWLCARTNLSMISISCSEKTLVLGVVSSLVGVVCWLVGVAGVR